MSLLTPINLLPQVSFVKPMPVVVPQFDFKTLRSMEQERQDAISSKNQYDFGLRLGAIQGLTQLNKSYLGLDANNPFQTKILTDINNNTKTNIDNLTSIMSNPDFDPVQTSLQIAKLETDISSNNGFKKVLSQQARHALNMKSIQDNFAKLDPNEIQKYTNNYLNYDGSGVDPTLNFNLSNMETYSVENENKFLNDYIGKDVEIITGVDANGSPFDGYKGKSLQSPEVMEKVLIDQYNQNGYRSGKSQDEYVGDLMKQYYNSYMVSKDNNGQETYWKVTEFPTVSKENKKDNSGHKNENKKNLGDAYDGIYESPTVNNPQSIEAINGQINIAENDYEKNTTQMYSGSFTESSSVIEGSEYKFNVLYDKFNKLSTEYNKTKDPEVGRELANVRSELTELTKQLNYKVGVFQTDTFDMSKSTISYDVLGNTVNKRGKLSEILASTINKNKSNKQFINIIENEIKPLYKIDNFNEFSKSIDKVADKYPNNMGVRVMTNAIKRELYRLASTSKTVNYGDNAHIATSKFEPQVKDADYQAHVVNKFDNVTVGEGKRSAIGGKIYSANTGKEITEDDKYIKTKGIQYNWRTGQYEIRAEVGTAITDDNNKFEKDPNGNIMLKNSQQAYIPDPNVNNTILHSIYSAYVPGNTQISDKLARDADVINKHIAKYVPYGQKKDIKLGNYYFTKTDQGWVIADVNHRVINQDAKGNIQYVPQQEIPIVIFQDKLGKIQNLQDPIEESLPQIPTQNSVLSKYGISNSNSGSGGSTNQPGKSMEQFNSELKEGLAKAESGGSYIVFNSKNQPKYGYPTFALGKYQFVPTSHPELMQFVIDNEELVNKNTINEHYKEYKQFYNKLHDARGTQKLYDEEHIMAYWVFLNSPEIQEAYMDKQLKSYEPYIEEVQKSQNVSRAEAIDLIHLYGVKGAKNKMNSPREWSSKINDPQQASLNLLFDEGQESGWKNLNSNAKDNIYKLLNKAGLSNFQFRVSSTNRNNSNAHSTNKTVDFKFPPNQERQVLQAIANLADDPQEALNLLYSQKGTDGNKVPSLKFKSGNQLIKIIYHADSDGHGNHLHIQVI